LARFLWHCCTSATKKTQAGQFDAAKGNPRRRGAAELTKLDVDGQPGEAAERTCKGRTPSESRGDGPEAMAHQRKSPGPCRGFCVSESWSAMTFPRIVIPLYLFV
jgi:hypothetical protein